MTLWILTLGLVITLLSYGPLAFFVTNLSSAGITASSSGWLWSALAYLAFFLLINQKKYMKEHIPRGGARVTWNILMSLSVLMTAALSFWCLWDKGGVLGEKILGIGRSAGSWLGLGVFVGFGILVVVVHYMQKGKKADG